jgi:hypothetical protein
MVTWSADLGFARTAPEIATIARAALTSLVSTGLVEEVEAEVSLGDPNRRGPPCAVGAARTAAAYGH